MWEAVAALLAIAGAIINSYLSARAKREEHTYANDLARFDAAQAAGDADSLSAAFDELRTPAGDGDPGGPDDPEAR